MKLKHQVVSMILFVGAMVLLANLAFAQGDFSWSLTTGLIRHDAVHNELRLDDNQRAAVKKIAEDIHKKSGEEKQKLRGYNAKERQEKMVELNKSLKGEVTKSLKGVLSPGQFKRLDEIRLQRRGFLAFTEPDIQSKLKLTKEQQDEIQRLSRKFEASMQQINDESSRSRSLKAATREIETLRDKTTQEAIGVLDGAQKEAWTELKGEPFEVEILPPPPV